MTARELKAQSDSEGEPSSTSAAVAVAANDCEGAAPRRVSQAMEEEVYGLLGALLGLLEVLSIDVQDPLSERQRRLVNDALRFGDMVRGRVEALVTLFVDEREPRFTRTPYALRRLIDHAVRAASWAAAEKGVSILLPAGEHLETELLVDAARVDRALRAITDTLVAAVGQDGQVALHVEDRPHTVELKLVARRDVESTPSTLSLSALMLSAWEHVFRLQGGSLRVDASTLSVFMELPKRSPGDRR